MLYTHKLIFLLNYKEILYNKAELDSSVPSVIKTVMQEYSNVFLDEMPKRLLLFKGIKHQIDFVSGAQIPNRSAYRSNHKETKELQRQVKELLEKGHVRESLSLCVVPILLVLKKDAMWHTCVDCRAVNKIMVKYRDSISKLDDMLDELHDARFFTKIDFISD